MLQLSSRDITDRQLCSWW